MKKPIYELVKCKEYNGKKTYYTIVFISWNHEELRWEIKGDMNCWFNMPEEDFLAVIKIIKYFLDLLNSTKLEEE